jgi:hypothetical protein
LPIFVTLDLDISLPCYDFFRGHIAKFSFCSSFVLSSISHLQQCQICTRIVFLRATHSKIQKSKEKGYIILHGSLIGMPTFKSENCPTPGEKHTCNHWQGLVELGSMKFHSQ